MAKDAKANKEKMLIEAQLLKETMLK